MPATRYAIAGGVPACAAAFAAGTALLQQQAALPSPLWCYALPAAGFLNLLASRSEGRLRAASAWLWLLIAAAAGFLVALAWAQVRLSQALHPAWEGRDVRLTGVVAELPQATERGVRFRFDVEQAEPPPSQLPRHLALTWYLDQPGALQQAAVRPGQRWVLTVRLRRPHGNANPHGFDLEHWMLERAIRATGYVRAQPPPRLVAPLVQRPGYWLERTRDAARERVLGVLRGHPQAGVIAALAIGDQQAIDTRQWTVFTRTGVNHLMSISGLHITMIGSLVFAIVLRLWPLLGQPALWLPARKAAAWLGLAAALGYALLSGFAVPAQRTVAMLAVVAMALAHGRPVRSSDVLGLAVIAVLGLDPWAVGAPGFWLSFGAVALILYVTAGRLERPGTLGGWVRVQAAISVGLTPLLVALFQQASLVSPLANAVAVPLVSLGVVPLALLGTGLPLDIALGAAAWLMAVCCQFLEMLSALPAAVWSQHAPPAWALLVAGLGVAWLLAPRGFPARWVGAVALLPLCLTAVERPQRPHYWVDVLDVGQGLALLVRTAEHALLFDAGPAFSRDADSGARIVVPHLRALGVRQLDAFLVSHDDIDHTGGMRAVLEAVPVRSLLTSLPGGDARLQAVRAVRCEAGTSWEWDGVRFALLHPAAGSYNQRSLSDNDRSCVLRVASSAGSVLVAADIEAESEAQLLQRAARYNFEQVQSDVLIVPHHGSSTSSTPAFLRAVDPRIGVFTVGYRNRFGHPAPEIAARYADQGTTTYRTDLDGAVLLRFDARFEAAAWRRVRPRYWHDR